MENVNMYIGTTDVGKVTVTYPDGGKITYNYLDPYERAEVLRDASAILMKRGYKPLSIVRVGKHLVRNFVYV